jgi:FtsH-binding integral membrane protein
MQNPHHYSRTGNPFTVAESEPDARALFIRRTYGHLAGAILAFALITAGLLQWEGAAGLAGTMTTGYNWLIVIGLFMAVSWVADKWARSDASATTQYMGLGLYIVALSVIFLPLMYVAAYYSSPDVIPTAGIITGLLFGGLTATAFITRKDFSFLRGVLTISFFVAIGVIVASIMFGFTLGVFFASIMVAVAGASILYTTSNIIHEYNPNQHVAAALALFAGVGLLFYYVLYLLISLNRD